MSTILAGLTSPSMPLPGQRATWFAERSDRTRKYPSRYHGGRIAEFDSRFRCGMQISKASCHQVNRAMLPCIRGLLTYEESGCDLHSQLPRPRHPTHPHEFDHRQLEPSVILPAAARHMYSSRENPCYGESMYLPNLLTRSTYVTNATGSHSAWSRAGTGRRGCESHRDTAGGQSFQS